MKPRRSLTTISFMVSVFIASLAAAACSPEASEASRADARPGEPLPCGDERERAILDAALIEETRALVLGGRPNVAPCDEGAQAAAQRRAAPAPPLLSPRRGKEAAGGAIHTLGGESAQKLEEPALAAAEPAPLDSDHVAAVDRPPADVVAPPFDPGAPSPPIDGDTSPPWNGDIIE